MDEAMANEDISLKPIGYFRSAQVHPYEAGRQPDLHHSEGVIELNSGCNFEQAMSGLEGCERIWIVFLFHHNSHWNPMVLPPRGTDTKIGVFATRSPYRPNPIGISCVKIVRIEKLKMTVEGADILDGTPILDIKPYVAYADSFPNSEPEWLKSSTPYKVQFSIEAQRQLEWLNANGVSQLRAFLMHQLEYDATNSRKKRVKKTSEDEYTIAYRTWRALFKISSLNITVYHISSGYSLQDLAEENDTYQDKEIHRHYKKIFSST